MKSTPNSSAGREGGSGCCFCKHTACVPFVNLSNKFKSPRLLCLSIHLPVCLHHIFLGLHLLFLLDTVHEDREPKLRSKVTFPDFSGKIHIFPKTGKMGLKMIKNKFFRVFRKYCLYFYWK